MTSATLPRLPTSIPAREPAPAQHGLAASCPRLGYREAVDRDVARLPRAPETAARSREPAQAA